MAKLDWRRAQLYGRPSLDHRYENDVPDRADRWLAAAERRQMQRRRRPWERRSFSATQVSSL
jgi:hypothetical protein